MIEIERRNRPRAEISMAPLIDCIFLLLIFFLLTSTFAQRELFEIELPAAQSSEVNQEKMIEVTCKETGELFINDNPVNRENLIPKLRRLLAETETNDIMLIADRRVKLEELTVLIDKIKKAGGSSVGIATRRSGDG